MEIMENGVDRGSELVKLVAAVSEVGRDPGINVEDL